MNDVTDRVRLEPCHMHVEPPMKPEVEQLTYPAELARSLDLDVSVGESGLTVSGSVFDMSPFTSVLSLVVMTHWTVFWRQKPVPAAGARKLASVSSL